MDLYQLQKQAKTMIILKVNISKFLDMRNYHERSDFVNLYITLEGIVPAKRTRRSMVPSPSPAEGQAAKPESTAIISEVSTV